MAYPKAKPSHIVFALLPLLVWMIQLLAQSLIEDISPEFYDTVGSLISYKSWLNLSMLLLLAVTALGIYLYNLNKSLGRYFETDTQQQPKRIQEKSPEETTQELFKKRIRLFDNLSKNEKEFLRVYFKNDNKTQNVHVLNDAALSLERNGIVFRASTFIDSSDFVISEWAWEMLKDFPQYLK